MQDEDNLWEENVEFKTETQMTLENALASYLKPEIILKLTLW